jgi:hypothetical protein
MEAQHCSTPITLAFQVSFLGAILQRIHDNNFTICSRRSLITGLGVGTKLAQHRRVSVTTALQARNSTRATMRRIHDNSAVDVLM